MGRGESWRLRNSQPGASRLALMKPLLCALRAGRRSRGLGDSWPKERFERSREGRGLPVQMPGVWRWRQPAGIAWMLEGAGSPGRLLSEREGGARQIGTQRIPSGAPALRPFGTSRWCQSPAGRPPGGQGGGLGAAPSALFPPRGEGSAGLLSAKVALRSQTPAGGSMRTLGHVVGLLLSFQAALAMSELRWCTVSDPEQQKCLAMAEAFKEAGIRPALGCVQETPSEPCIHLIEVNKADAVTLDGGAIYEAGKYHGLKPVVGEMYDQEAATSYYAVAVVRRGSSLTINHLRGARSCHTGLNRTAGWNVPVGYLVESGRLAVMGCDVLRAVSSYFGGSCVPGAAESGYADSLCRLCRGDAAGEGRCAKSPLERYYDYSGAFRCLADGAGDVAFVKHSTVLENTDGKTLSSWGEPLLSQDFQLLCRDGSRAPVTQWRHCHLARVPAHAVVVRADTDGDLVFRMLNEGQARFNHAGAPFQMFESEAFQQRNLLFKDSTIELVPIATSTYQAWLGPDYLQAMAGLLCDPDRLPSHLRWCVLSTPEIQKCGDMAVALSRKQLKPEIQCVSGESPQHCMEQIQAKEADVITLSGGDIYTAGQKYGLVPAAGESYPDNSKDAYYAVALVKRNSSYSFTLDELRGKRSCHSGYGMASGWDIPVGVLVQRGFIRPKGCDVLRAVSEFFSASCVPVNNAKDYPSRLCELCIGDDHGLNKCHGNSQERYYGYGGAFRCLAEGAGDVAFVKHSTVFENTDGHNPEAWAVGLKSRDYELLCPNGARAEVTQFQACSLARVPAHAVMVHPDTNVFAVYGLLDKAQDLFGNDSNKNGFRMFDSSDYRGQDLLFRDSTERLLPVGGETSAEAWLGPAYVASLEGLQSVQCSGAAGPRAPGLPVLLLLLPLSLGSVLGGPAPARLP
ncbi:melanotransferrin [Monodelphis domestica]|uniref:melanotransferrin n=1 Tax=Monodelphis domestica TaxID=13616 RepID=UPI0024E1C60A|nr:melanotransferrin [Monodelphis domestica]